MKFSDLTRSASAISAIVLFLCLQICNCQSVASCHLGPCIEYRTCPILRPAVSLSSNESSAKAMDLLKQHQCGDSESKSVCCVDLAADLVRHNILVNSTDENSTIALAQLMGTPCGKSEESISLISSQAAFIREFPWMALLEYNTTSGTEVMCAGSLISDRYVLTAAHCINTPTVAAMPVSVRLGEYDISKEVDCISEQCIPAPKIYQIEAMTIHPDYKHRVPMHDIGLIRLKNKVENGDRIFPICLPVLNELIVNIDAGVVAGWNIYPKETSSNILLKAPQEVLSNDLCSQLYNRNFSSPSYMCVGNERKENDCIGDSGGPIFSARRVRNNSYGFVQYGILSSGLRICGAAPDIYINVVHYMPWILKTIKP